MGVFEITSPDGKKYRIEGETKEGALAALREHLGDSEPNPMRDRIEAAKAGTLPISQKSLDAASAADQIAQDEMVLSGAGPVGGVVTSMAQGLPFIGEWTDEMAEGIVPGSGERMRATQDAMERQRPKTALASQVAGGIIGSVPAVLAAPVAAPAVPASMAGRVVAGGLTGAALGGTEGAVSGAGRNEQDRAAGAALGGKIGAGAGGVLGAAAPVVSAGFKNALSRFKTSDVRTISKQLKVDIPTARIVKQSLVNDDLGAAEAALRAVGSDAMLADAGIGTRRLLDDAMTSGGPATRIGREAVEGRAATAAPEITRALDNVLGSPAGVKSTARGISKRTAEVRAKAYDKAYSQAIDYAAAQGRKIEAVLDRIPSKTIRSAIDEANDAMKASGIRNQQIMAEIADDGSVVFREMPNVQQLDELKKALGAVANNEVDQFGRPTAAGLRARRLAGELRDAIGDAVGPYKAAVRLGGDKIAEDNALDLGRRVLSGTVKREDVADAMKGASREARDAFRAGLRSNIDETLAQVKRTITDPNTDAREAMKAIKDLSSRANREKVASAIGDAQARKLFSIIDRETVKLELRAAVANNSATAIRRAGKEAMDTEMAPGVVGRAARAEPVGAFKEIVQILTNTTPQADLAKRQARYADIAKALTSIRGQDAQDALQAVRKAMQGQPMAEAEARSIANMLTGSLALGGYQTGTRQLNK